MRLKGLSILLSTQNIAQTFVGISVVEDFQVLTCLEPMGESSCPRRPGLEIVSIIILTNLTLAYHRLLATLSTFA